MKPIETDADKDGRTFAVPLVHLNGTSREELEGRVRVAAHAIHQTILAMSGAAPNARDFYPQGCGAFERARREHDDRARRLESVARELEAVYEAIVGQRR